MCQKNKDIVKRAENTRMGQKGFRGGFTCDLKFEWYDGGGILDAANADVALHLSYEFIIMEASGQLD